MAAQSVEHYGLGDPLMLGKIDKLFACGVGEHVNLPQIVVVGDQSSGKSSILEGLIRMAVARDSGLCTRFATQIIFRRSVEERISVSIITDRNATPEHKNRIEAWSKSDIKSLDPDTFMAIMREVHDTMGVSQVGDTSGQKQTFSNDVLRLEITGPDQEHLSVIDVPGIFKTTTPGLTTKPDIALVKDMVLGYMENPRSVMLTVVPANVDVATQEILQFANDVDPNGTEPRVIDLVKGRTRVMKLGWHVVRNPGQQQLSDSSVNRQHLEAEFFRLVAPWKSISVDKVGIESLRDRLKEVLSTLVRQEFPKVKQEIGKKIVNAQKQLTRFGPERSSPSAQAAYLTGLATRYQQLVMLSLQAKFASDELFDLHPSLRMAPAVTSRSAIFDKEMARCGHKFSFCPTQAKHSEPAKDGWKAISDTDSSMGESPVMPKEDCEVRREDDVEDLAEILHAQESLAHPNGQDIESWLRDVYETSRGFELGTFDSSILATTMKKQSSKWTSISLGYVSDAIVIVHRFITTALHSICYDDGMKESLFSMLSDGLLSRYTKAIGHVEFLLAVERNGTPITTNHYFNDNLDKCRQDRMLSAMQEFSFHDRTHGSVVRLSDAKRTHPMSNTDHIGWDIHNVLQSYYKVARKRFVDNAVKQATDHFLLTGPETPLDLFSPSFVSSLATEDLEHIAGESPRIKRERARLLKEIASLTEGRSILLRG